MSDFSPQAQAILDASHFPQRWEHAIAAVLRAAADQVIEEVSPVEALLAIADELDGGAQ